MPVALLPSSVKIARAVIPNTPDAPVITEIIKCNNFNFKVLTEQH